VHQKIHCCFTGEKGAEWVLLCIKDIVSLCVRVFIIVKTKHWGKKYYYGVRSDCLLCGEMNAGILLRRH
jgi:hypothetical protein